MFLALFKDIFDLLMKPESIDSPGSLYYMKKIGGHGNLQLQINKCFTRCRFHVVGQNYINSDEKPIMWYLKMIFTLTCPAISLICRFVTHTLVVLLVMEILGMESLEDDPAMSTATGEKVERTAFLLKTAREVVMRAWGCVP